MAGLFARYGVGCSKTICCLLADRTTDGSQCSQESHYLDKSRSPAAEAYTGLFQKNHKGNFDATPQQFGNPRTPSALHRMMPAWRRDQARFLVILREPVGRLLSFYNQRTINSPCWYCNSKAGLIFWDGSNYQPTFEQDVQAELKLWDAQVMTEWCENEMNHDVDLRLA